MKKVMRKLVSLVLVALLIASMTVPISAANYISTDVTSTYGQYSYTGIVVCKETTGTASFNISPYSTTVKAQAVNQLHDVVNNQTGNSEVFVSTGFGSTYATADNYLIVHLEGEPYRFVSEIKSTTGTFWIGSEMVVPGINDYPDNG